MNRELLNGEAVLPFAKIVDGGKYGQVVMFAMRGEQGEPAVVLHVSVPEVGICAVTMSFADEDERDDAWNMAPLDKISDVIEQLYIQIETAKKLAEEEANKPAIIMPPGITH